MRDTRFDSRSSEWIGDLTVWKRQNDPDNAEQLDRLRRNLRQARERGLTMAQIARRLDVNRSTVCRTLHRAQERLYRHLRYGL